MTDQTTASLTYINSDLLLRDWIIEFDADARRLKITREWLGLRPKTIVDCSFDECISVGTIRYAHEAIVSFGVYVWIKTGRKHGIPHDGTSAEAAGRVADEISAMTGIPRLDIEEGTI